MFAWKPHNNKVRRIVFLGDGRNVATIAGNSRFVWVWDVTTGQLVRKLDGHRNTKGNPYRVANYVRGLTAAADGRTLASADNNNTALVWDGETGRAMARLHFPGAGWGDSLALSPDGRHLAWAGWNIACWTDPGRGDGDDRPPDRTLEADRVSGVAFSPDSRWLVANRSAGIAFWHVGAEARFVRPHALPQDGVGEVAFSPDGTRFATARWSVVQIWRRDDWGPERVLAGHKLTVRAVAFSPDGQTVLTAGSDGTVRFWDVQTGVERRRYDFGVGKVYSAAFAPDGLTCVAGGGKGLIVVWDLDL